MANNFTTLKNNQALDKFILCRLQPTRYVNALLTLQGGSIYEMTFPYPIADVKANSVALTKVTSPPATGEWSYNETTKLLEVNSTPSGSNAITVDFYIFVTGERNRVVTEDPENTATTKRDWEPLIDKYPSVLSGVENIVTGSTFSISSSSLTLLNDAKNFYNYVSDVDSFFKKPVQMWLCFENTENIQKIYDGKTTDIDLNDRQVIIKFDDPMSLLLEPALFGDGPDAYFHDNLPGVTTLDPNSRDLPLPLMLGKVTRYQLVPDLTTNLTNAQKIERESMYGAVCINYDTNIGTSVNRDWGCCRVLPDGFANFAFTPSNISNADANFTRLDGTAAEIAKIFIGDTFDVNQAGNHYNRVKYVDRTLNYVYITKDAGVSTGANVVTNNVPSVVISDFSGNTYYPLYGRDYTATTQVTAGGNTLVYITFTNNFEATVGMATLDPGVHLVQFRVKPDTTNMKHGAVLKTLIENAGLTTNAASFTAANAALANNTAFSIPYFDQQDYSNYLRYAQDIIKSTLGYIALNNSFEIKYGLFATPSSVTDVTDTDILFKTFKVDLNYKDIVNEIISFNPHYASSEAIADATNTPSKTLSNDVAKHLHGIDRTIRFRHLLERIDNKLQDILDVRSERYALYSFDTKTINADNIIGDDLQITRSGLPGGIASRDFTIVGLSKNSKKVTVTVSDLLNL